MPSIVFLAFESPWPAYSGDKKRVLGLLKELSQAFTIDLRLLVRAPLTPEQEHELLRHAQRVVQIPRRDQTMRDRIAVVARMMVQRLPYHAAVVEHSLAAPGAPREARIPPQACVYANLLHWAAPLRHRRHARWILDQQNADWHFWELYAQHSANPWVRLVALVNHRLTQDFCVQVYPKVARIVAVCEQDRELTRVACDSTPVDVIPNGVDCDYFSPRRPARPEPVLLFTGTSDERNMHALRYFVREVYPLVRQEVPDVRFVVAGNLSKAAQAEFVGIPGVSCTGSLPDLRPIYNQSAVFVSPFREAYGSKLKVSEALAMGICVISTPAGVRGMPVKDEQSVLIGRDGPHMAQQIVRALQDPALARRIGRAGRAAALEHLDWRRVLGPRLRAIVAEVVAGQRQATRVRQRPAQGSAHREARGG